MSGEERSEPASEHRARPRAMSGEERSEPASEHRARPRATGGEERSEPASEHRARPRATGDARETILRAAARCIARKGARGLRVLDVAKEAGVSSGLLYYHFADRDGLLAATLEHINAEALGHRERDRRQLGATDRLLALLIDEIEETAEVRDNSVAWNELRASAVFDTRLAGHLSRTSAKWDADIASAVREAQAAGEVDSGVDADRVAGALTALVEGLSGRWLSGQLSTDEATTILRDAAVRLLR